MSHRHGVVGMRAKRARQAARLHDREGLNGREIAYRLGISTSYAMSLLSDPNGAKDRERKRSYGGTCVVCGARTTGSDGRRLAPEVCATCAPDHYRKWTRERILEAIREWARRFGHAPTAMEWGVGGNGEHACRITEDGYEFPWAGTVYDNCGGQWKPVFESWADAIEEAGFPRPSHNRNYNPEPWKVENMTDLKTSRPYLVLRVDDEGQMHVHAEVVAPTIADALEETVQEPGRYRVVAMASLSDYELATRMVARVVRDTNGDVPRLED